MKTLRKTAEEAYLKYANKIINRETWIDGFISGIQYKKEYPQSIELCGLLWDTENLAIGGYEKDGHHYYTWHEAMEAARSVGKRLPTWQEWKALCDLGSTWDDERKGRWFGVITTRTTRARYSCLLRACATTIAASWPTRAPAATIGPRRRTTEATTSRATLPSARASSTRCTTAVTPTASAYVVYKTNNIYMKIFKYRLPSGKHILIYRSRDNKSSDYFQYVEEYTKKDIELPIFNEDTLFDTMQGKRTEDKILVENGIESIQDLSECYCQIRNKVSNLSKKVRDLVIKKYSDIINNYNFDK